MTTILEPNQVTAHQYRRRAQQDAPESGGGDQVRAARARFLAQHGPGAEVARRTILSKEERKALRAAEMARWECFPPSRPSPAA